MSWKKNTPEKVALLEEALLAFPCERKKMFGCPVYFVNGNMFTGVLNDAIFLRLSPADRHELLAGFVGAAPFEPLPGRVMREYVVLPGRLVADRETFHGWLARSFGNASLFPPKEAKPPKKKGA